jgi:hypothetical protein
MLQQHFLTPNEARSSTALAYNFEKGVSNIYQQQTKANTKYPNGNWC